MSYTHLTQEDRIALAALLRAGHSQTECAHALGVHRSTMSRELRRNRAPDETYHAGVAKRMVRERHVSARAGCKKLLTDTALRQRVMRRLRRYDSPEQIAGVLRRENDGVTVVSHETIYQWIYSDAPQYKKYLRCQKGKYRRRYGTNQRRALMKDRTKKPIELRPDIVQKRIRLGDYEGDTIVGKGRTQRILTLVDRVSGYTYAYKLTETRAHTVTDLLARWSRSLPTSASHTLTLDNGTEFSDHERLQRDGALDVFFCTPYHSWERGSNENTNGLLRQFFPKGSSFTDMTQEDVDRAVRNLNTRPRKRLNYATPADVYFGRVALGG